MSNKDNKHQHQKPQVQEDPKPQVQEQEKLQQPKPQVQEDPKPQVQEQVKVTETPVQEPKKEESTQQEAPKGNPQRSTNKEELISTISRITDVIRNDTQDGRSAGRAHYSLYRRMIAILNEDSSNTAKELWKELIKFTRDNSDVFNLRTFLSYASYWSSDKKSYDIYRKLVFVVIRYNPGNLKDNTRQVNIEDILDSLNPKQGQNFRSIYNLD